jgi:hypothetical protein
MSRPVKLGVLFSLGLLCSALVSSTPSLTVYKGGQILLLVLFGHFWVVKYGPASTLGLIVKCCLVLCAGLLAAGVFAPEAVWAGSRLMGGAFGSSGSVSALLIVGALSGGGLGRSRLKWVALVLGGALLILSQIRTAYVVVALYVVVSTFASPARTRAWRVVVALAAIAPFVAGSELWARFASAAVRDPASITNLSERVPLWQQIVGTVWQSAPILGIGFYTSRRLSLAFNTGIGSAHSAYVEVLVGAGVIGSMLLALVIISLMTRLVDLLRSDKRPQVRELANLTAGLAFVCLGLGLTSDEMVTGGPAAFAFFTLLSVTGGLGRPQDRHKARFQDRD